VPHAVVNRDWFSGTGAEGAAFPGYASAEDICAIASSSGTTGAPKYMERMAGSLAIEFAAVDQGTSGGYFSRGSVVSARFPIGSFLGFQQVLAVVLAGGRLMLANPATRLRGELAQMAASGVTHVLASPAQVMALCAEAPQLDRRFQSLLVAGAMVTPTMLRTWLRYFESVRIGYASRESAAVGFVKLDEVVDTRDLAYDMDERGEVQVVDADGTVLPPDTDGILRFRRKYMVTSYLGDAAASADVFRDGWFYSGDLGHLDARGRLHVTGRLFDQINLGGVKFNAAAVDAAAASVDGVEAAMCFAAERSDGLNELKLCLSLRPDADLAAIAPAVRLAVKQAVRANVAAIYEVPMIPANENGKPLRMYGPKLTSDLLSL
jgi:acyl-coenzyme A synthetase/AMP-(fatty) acid ligase